MTKNNTNLSQIIFLVLAFVAGVLTTRFWYSTRGAATEVDVPEEISLEEDSFREDADIIETEDMDEDTAEMSLSPTDEAGIVAALADKHDKDGKDVSITPQKVDESNSYVMGGVILGEGPGNAGMFWAYKEEGEWKIAADGNGNPSCDVLEDAGFPEDMQESCY